MNVLLFCNDVIIREKLPLFCIKEAQISMLLLVMVIGIDFLKLIKISEIDCVIVDLSSYNLKEFDIMKLTIGNVPLIVAYDNNLLIQDDKLLEGTYKKFLKPINYEEILCCLEELRMIRINSSTEKQQIIRKLLNIGFNVNNIGTGYLIEAIEYSIKDSKLKTLKEIYIVIANKHSISHMKVKWAIQNSVNKLNCSVDESKLQKFFKIKDNRKLTPKYIINFFKVYS